METTAKKTRSFWPNALTFLGSVCALGALWLAYAKQDRSFAYILLGAGLIDAVDGPLARRLQAQSAFGTVYDGMSDFLSFGIAPAASLIFLRLIHPVVAAIYLLAIQFRLTRYASSPERDREDKFFRGLSAPDCVWVGTLAGLVPCLNFNYGFALAAVLAVYPGKLWPKGYRLLKALIGAGVCVLFVRGG